MNTDDDEIRHRGLVMARTDEFLAREREERETAALISKALEPRGARPAAPTRIDLDDLERRITADHNARLSRAQSLALIARIRELEVALLETGDAFGMLADYYEKGVPLHRGRRERIRELIERGAVLP